MFLLRAKLLSLPLARPLSVVLPCPVLSVCFAQQRATVVVSLLLLAVLLLFVVFVAAADAATVVVPVAVTAAVVTAVVVTAVVAYGVRTLAHRHNLAVVAKQAPNTLEERLRQTKTITNTHTNT